MADQLLPIIDILRSKNCTVVTSCSQLAFTVSCLGHVDISAKTVVGPGRVIETRLSNTNLLAETFLGMLSHMTLHPQESFLKC